METRSLPFPFPPSGSCILDEGTGPIGKPRLGPAGRGVTSQKGRPRSWRGVLPEKNVAGSPEPHGEGWERGAGILCANCEFGGVCSPVAWGRGVGVETTGRDGRILVPMRDGWVASG